MDIKHDMDMDTATIAAQPCQLFDEAEVVVDDLHHCQYHQLQHEQLLHE